MNVGIYQFETVWMDHTANLALIEKVCSDISGNVDLLVLPEMFNTGYTMQPAKIPSEWQDETIQTLQRFAAIYKLTISGSIPMYRNGHYYNTFITVGRGGLLHKYDKIHLFTLAGEKEVYTPGKVVSTFELYDWKIMPLICYDLRFPYLISEQKMPDLLIYSANWPEMRVDHWIALLKARAIENQCYVIGINRVGQDQNGYIYPGASVVINYNGDVIKQMNNQNGYTIQHLDKANMAKFREKLPFYLDHLRR